MVTAVRLAALLGLLAASHALFEEQAGIVDWYKENVGRVTHAEFAFRGRERVFLGTEAGVVASLDTRDGSIAWRQVLEEGDSIDALVLVPRPASVLTLSKSGTLLRAWHALDGTLLWEKAVAQGTSDTSPSLLVLPDITGDGSSEIAVAAGPQLQVISAPSGKLVWSSSLPGVLLAAELGDDATTPTLLALTSEPSGLKLRAFGAKTGEEISAAEFIAAAEQFSLGSAAAAAVRDGQLYSLTAAGVRSKPAALASILPSAQGPIMLGKFLQGNLLALHSGAATHVVDVTNGFKVISSSKGLASAAAAEGGAAGLAGVDSNGRLVTALVDLSSGKRAESHSYPTALTTADGTQLSVTVLAISSRKAGDYSTPQATIQRWLVAAEDDTLYYLEGGSILWQREEGLGSVTGTLFVDLPARRDVDSQEDDGQVTLTDRINAEVLTIKSSFGIIQPDEKLVLKQLNARLSTNLLPHRDSNGFRKLILALSASGKLYGLHSGDGRALWKLPLGTKAAYSRLFLWRASGEAHQAPEVLLLGTSGGKTRYLVVNAHTGAVIHAGFETSVAQQVIPLPTLQQGKAEQHVYALLTADLQAVLMPDAAATRDGLSKQPLHFWRHHAEQGVLAGYRLDSVTNKAVQQWALSFPGPTDGILQIGVKDPAEHVYSYAKVLGDRSLKLKYLNPNAILVVSGPPNAAAAGAGDAALSVQLIDAVSGVILFRSTLNGASGPVQTVLSENWAVYSYYSTASQRHEIAVLEFFEDRAAPLNIPSLLFGTQNDSLSAFAPPPLEVLHQSYFLGSGLKALSVTATRKGITSKQLLLGTTSNQVYLMDKRFVDPRRPSGTPTEAQKAEMLPPYHEELGFMPQLFATHGETVERLRGIVTSPANLESTTLAFSHGLDLFFTRVQPSKSFDLLPDDFPYALLVLVTAALAVGAFVLQRMDTAASIKRKWL